VYKTTASRRSIGFLIIFETSYYDSSIISRHICVAVRERISISDMINISGEFCEGKRNRIKDCRIGEAVESAILINLFILISEAMSVKKI
jgi:hypothetical protein